MKLPLTLAGSVLALAACASGPEYREASNDRAEGYSEIVIEKNRYRVDYRLDDARVGKAQDYALLRAAELTMEKGYETFEVVGESSDVKSETTRDRGFGVDRSRTMVTRDCGLLTCTTRTAPVYGSPSATGIERTQEETFVTIEIILSDLDASTSVRHYDASQVAANLRSSLQQ